MSTTNSHLQKILDQAEQDTAADYNTELDPEIEAVPKHQAPLSIQATQLITSAPRRPPDINRKLTRLIDQNSADKDSQTSAPPLPQSSNRPLSLARIAATNPPTNSPPPDPQNHPF